jgi:hypothetical protein
MVVQSSDFCNLSEARHRRLRQVMAIEEKICVTNLSLSISELTEVN